MEGKCYSTNPFRMVIHPESQVGGVGVDETPPRDMLLGPRSSRDLARMAISPLPCPPPTIHPGRTCDGEWQQFNQHVFCQKHPGACGVTRAALEKETALAGNTQPPPSKADVSGFSVSQKRHLLRPPYCQRTEGKNSAMTP